MRTEHPQNNSRAMPAKSLTLAVTIGLLLTAASSRALHLECGQAISGTVSSAGQTDTHTFDGNAGEAVVIFIYGQPGFPQYFNAKAEVYDPKGALICSFANNGWGIYLTNSGLYSVLIHADDYAHVGQYGLSLFFPTGRCGPELTWGLPTTGTIKLQGQVDAYRFRGNTGEIINLSTYGQPGFPQYFDARLGIANPDGIPIGICTNSSVTVTLTNTGTYTVWVEANGLNHLGTYSLSLSFLHLVVPASYCLGIGTTNGAANLKLWGQKDAPTTILYATNMVATNRWFTLTNFALPSSPYHLIDWASTNSQRRFYRFVQPMM